MPELGIIGFERSGKTAFFNAVTGAQRPVGFAAHTEPHVGVVKVPDERLDRLSALYRPRKHTPADLRYVDYPGSGFGAGAGPASQFLDTLSQMDALIHVVRAFENDAVPPPQERVDPARDIEAMTLELSFADLALIEKRLERIAAENKALKIAERARGRQEEALLQRIREPLADGVLLRAVPLEPHERRQLRQYRFLTERPLLTLLNVDEVALGDAAAIAARHRPAEPVPDTATAALCASLEMDLVALSEGDAVAYRREVGAAEGAVAIAVRLSYEILGLLSFFTVGEDECRAWAIARGTHARAAAGKIHSDLERGFIRAEVVGWEALIDAGSEAEARKRAALRSEGKDYVVQDGDVLHVLFNL